MRPSPSRIEALEDWAVRSCSIHGLVTHEQALRWVYAHGLQDRGGIDGQGDPVNTTAPAVRWELIQIAKHRKEVVIGPNASGRKSGGAGVRVPVTTPPDTTPMTEMSVPEIS